MVIAIVVQLGLGAAVFMIGRWGHSNAEALVPARLPDDNRGRRVRAARRGAIACQVAGVILALTNLILLF
ncbi:hypothetical protein [Candidatus Protofrankia californiensis]|uniref:hypothetical protein n=1 Tax=Candidatus Protofrankia californiensis TaxID=1839754 RepID=UPI001041B05E|nr:hypothetical protein [Candidatus Protofrankia californiensis]